jgi:glycosyltransferase involved in cell wall biosynthesis
MKICFVAHSVYPFFFSGAEKGQIGGAEFQQKLIGEALAARGKQVSFISHDVGQPDFTKKNDLTFIRSFAPNAGLPGVRFFYPRLTEIWKALRRADADVYYVRCAGFIPGILALFCRLNSRKYIFAAASDTDFEPGREMVRLARDRWLFRLGIRKASRIVVQSEYQKETLLSNYGLTSSVIRNYYQMTPSARQDGEQNLILWVATVKGLKRPFRFVELAERFPNERFVMIGGPDSASPGLYEEVRTRCAGIPNLDFLGFLPVEEAERYFDRCKVLVNTSDFEGFPNTFLQAWGRGVPVLSHVDPDGIINNHQLGYAVSDEQQMADALGKLLAATPDSYRERTMGYFRDNHSDRIIDRYCSMLEELSGCSK